MSGTLVKIDIDGTITEIRYEKKTPGLEALQEAVGGYIERITAYYINKRYTAWVDEDGIPKGLELNTMAMRKYVPMVAGQLTSIVGPLVIEVPDAKTPSSSK